MSEVQFFAVFVIVSALWGGFWWWLLSRIAGWKAVAEAGYASPILRGVGLVIGLGLPMMALLAAILHSTM